MRIAECWLELLGMRVSSRLRLIMPCCMQKWSVLVLIALCLGMGCSTAVVTDFRVYQTYSGGRMPKDQIAILVVKDGVAMVELDGYDLHNPQSGNSHGTLVMELKPRSYTGKLEYKAKSRVGAPLTIFLNMKAGHVYLLEPELLRVGTETKWFPKYKDITNTSEGAIWLEDVSKRVEREWFNLE